MWQDPEKRNRRNPDANAARWREAELMGARLAITLVVGVIAAYMTYFVLTYIGTDMAHSFAPVLIVIGIAAAFAFVAFLRS